MKIKDLSKKLDLLKVSKNLINDDIAKTLGVSSSSIDRLHKLESVPKSDMLVKLCHLLGESPNDLLDWKVTNEGKNTNIDVLSTKNKIIKLLEFKVGALEKEIEQLKKGQ